MYKETKKEMILWSVVILVAFGVFIALVLALEADNRNTKKRYQDFVSNHACNETDTKTRTIFMKKCMVSAWSTLQGCHNEWKVTYCTPPELKEAKK